MRRFILIIVMAALLLCLPQQARAQSGIVVDSVQVIDSFGEHVTFVGRIQSAVPITHIDLVFTDNFDNAQRRFPVQVDENGIVTYRYNVIENVLRPFVTIKFHFEITLENGVTESSPIFTVQYMDDRFVWQQRVTDNLRVHWYDGDAAFGDALFEAVSSSLSAVETLLSTPTTDPVDVYVYASSEDLQSTLFLGGEDWQGGHANPKLGVVMLTVTPGPSQSLDMESLIPHELAHVLLYRAVGDRYERLPVWLTEGISSLAELYPNPDYQQALIAASESGALIPIVELCDTFPLDASRAYLAYAESDSFVRYIRDTYGPLYISSLVLAYADGLSCEQGVVRALSTSLVSLDTRWREAVLGQNVLGVFFRNMMPYLAIFIFLMLMPIIGLIQRRPKDDDNT